jgi:putative hydrolase of the HAD superfamily
LPNVTAIFSDVGGVLLTNGWDRNSRHKLVERFHLDWEEFEDRHELVSTGLETGQLSLDHYLDRTIFYRPRDFTHQDVRDFMFARSQANADAFALFARLAESRRYFLATLNNESRELNLYRIERFSLRNYFTAFFSSCFLGVMKPNEAIYRLALDISRRDPAESVFIDDRPLNLECAARLGMRTVLFKNAAQLERDLEAAGARV